MSLTVAIFLPAVAALLVALLPSRQKTLIKAVSLAAALATFFIVSSLAWNYRSEVAGEGSDSRLDHVMAKRIDELWARHANEPYADQLQEAKRLHEEEAKRLHELAEAGLKNPYLFLRDLPPDRLQPVRNALAKGLGLAEAPDWSSLAQEASRPASESRPPVELTEADRDALRGEDGSEETVRLVEEVNGLERIERAQLFSALHDATETADAPLPYLRMLEATNPAAYRVFQEIREAELARDSSQAKTMAYVQDASWISAFRIRYLVGADGLSLPLIWLTALLTVLCVLYSWELDYVNRTYTKAFFALFLLLEAGLIGVFCALDFFLFYVFWEVVLLPMYFLIGIWGDKRRIYAAIKFFIYTLVGSVLMLVAMLAMYFKSGLHTFNMLTLAETVPWMSYGFQWWIFMALFIGFAIKVPVFPFHTWLPAAHVQAPTAGSMVLAGILLKMGGYGFFRLSYPLCPEVAVSTNIIYFVAGLGMVNIVYGALVAMAQTDFKSLVAYSSISHMGFVLLGMAAVTHAGTTGAVLQMFNHGLSSAMLFALVGILKDHYDPRFRHRRPFHKDLNRFDGIALHMPYYTGLAMVGFFASLGLPGLNGFISEALTFLGAYHEGGLITKVGGRWIVYVSLSGIVLTAAYLLWTVQRVYLGEKDERNTFDDLTSWEWMTLLPLAALCILIGVAPFLILDYMDPTLTALLEPIQEFARYAAH